MLDATGKAGGAARRLSPAYGTLGFAAALAAAVIVGRETIGEPLAFYLAPIAALAISMLPAILARRRARLLLQRALRRP